jgi:hypothetical protein
LGLSDPAAHRILQEHLLRSPDPDGLRLAILTAMQRAFLGWPASLFGGAAPEVRRQILVGYLAAMAPLWRGATLVDNGEPHLERAAARLALQRAQSREFEATLRLALSVGDVDARADLLRCIADLQQVHLAPLLAEFVEDAEPRLRQSARDALQLLTFADAEFATMAQFQEWFRSHGNLPYVDLAERAARREPIRTEALRAELTRLRIDASREFVRARTVPWSGIDWVAIQARTLVDDLAVRDACLEELRTSLATATIADDQPTARLAFCRALLQTAKQLSTTETQRSALLLEVAGHVARAEDGDLATEVVGQLLAALDGTEPAARLGAIRTLRRYPNVDTRARLVRHALDTAARGQTEQDVLSAAVATLASRSAPRWFAPLPSDPDRADWLRLVRTAVTLPWSDELRDLTMTLALSLDARDRQVPEVFLMLVELAQDTSLGTKLRSTCLIHLQGWRDQQAAADEWVRSLQALLADPAPELRRQAAESLSHLPESVDARRSDWIAASIVALRDRLRAEPSPAVLRALVDSIQVLGREPQMPGRAIGAINLVLDELGFPIAAEHQFRIEPLLAALATIAGDSRADRGQWLAACRPLLQFEKRESMRLVLQSHSAVDLAKDVGAADSSQAARGLQAMQMLIATALLKPARVSWAGSEELLREAREVRAAFGALDLADEGERRDEPAHRLLRLEVDLAGGKFQEVVQRATSWLPPNGAANGRPMSLEHRDRVRTLVADAWLGLGKADAAARILRDFEQDGLLSDPRLSDLQVRIGKAVLAAEPETGVALLERAMRATPAEDPALRSRVVEWAQARLRIEPSALPQVREELARHALLFEAQDCLREHRDFYQQVSRGN